MVENIAGGRGPPLEPMEPMRIEVIGEDESSDAQARTYAEYQRVRGAGATHAACPRRASRLCDGTTRQRDVRDRRLRGDRGAGAFRLRPHPRGRSSTRMPRLTAPWSALATSCTVEPPERAV